MHDRMAELQGLRNELAHCENGPHEPARARAGEVREQIDRLRNELGDEAEALERRSEEQAADGQDVLAAQTAVAARTIRSALDEDGPSPATPKGRTATGGKRNAAAAKAPETT